MQAVTNVVPKKNQEYLEQSYWDDRFRQEDSYEWLIDYCSFKEQLASTLLQLSPCFKALRYLIIGCGNSSLGQDMLDDGYGQITNIDFSKVVIDKMKIRYPEGEYLEMDVREMGLETGRYDVVIDKALLDTLQAGVKDPWRVDQDTLDRLHACLKEVYRVINQNGLFLMLSFDQPHFRLPLLKPYQWVSKVTQVQGGRAFPYFLYQAQKVNEQSYMMYIKEEEEQKREEEKERQEHQEAIGNVSSSSEDEEALCSLFLDQDYQKCVYEKGIRIEYMALNSGSTDYDLTGQVIWQGASVLTQYMLTIQDKIKDRSVLELGSGPGVCGLCAHLLGAAHTTLSDYQKPVLDMISQTLLTFYPSPSIDYVSLDWTKVIKPDYLASLSLFNKDKQSTSAFLDSCYDILIGSDIVYWPASIYPLMQVLDSFFNRSQSLVFYMSYTERCSSTHKQLLEAFYHNHYQCLEVGQEVSKHISQHSYIYLITK